MPYDPTKPADGSLADAAELRAQFAAMKALIDALQAQVNALPTMGDVNAAITANSAGPCPGFPFLNLVASDPPTQAEVQAIADRFDELVTPLKRT